MQQRRDDYDGRDGISECGGTMKNIVTIDTTVTGAGQSQGGIHAGGDCRKAIQPEPLDAAPRTTLAARGRASPFLCLTASEKV